MTVYTYSVSSSGLVFPGGWRSVSFYATDTLLTMSVDGKIIAQNSADAGSGYYLELDSQGDNTLEVKDLVVTRYNFTPTPHPQVTTTYTLDYTNSSWAWVTDYYYGYGQHDDQCRTGGYYDTFSCMIKWTQSTMPASATKHSLLKAMSF